MIHCTLSCVSYITTLYDSMEAHNWRGFDKWMCFLCGRKFTLDKLVSYDSNTLQLLFSDCPHPACSICNSCFKWYMGPTLTTDFQQFNALRLDYQVISFTQDVLNTIVGVSDKECNKCFIFNLLVCFERAKIFRHIFDLGGSLMNLGIGTICTLQGLFDNVGNWSKSDFLDLARRLDAADDASSAARILVKVLKSF